MFRRRPMSGDRGAGQAYRGCGRAAPWRGSWRLQRAAGVGLAVLALVGACSPATATPGASRSVLPAGTPCAWPREVDAASDSYLIVDSGAAYWLEPFAIAPGLRITLSGTFPDARYASLAVCTRPTSSPFTRNGVGSSLTDYQIAPEPSGVNPRQQPGAPGGHYTVTLRDDVAPGQATTMPIAPAGTTSGQGLLVYRVYLPAGATSRRSWHQR